MIYKFIVFSNFIDIQSIKTNTHITDNKELLLIYLIYDSFQALKLC